MDIKQLGWNDFFESHINRSDNEGLIEGRISCENRNNYELFCSHGKLLAKVSGKFRHDVEGFGDFPAVGDWVLLSARPGEKSGTIHRVLPRQSKFSRKAILTGSKKNSGGKIEEQILAANVNTVFLVSGLDNDFNLRRVERYLSIAWDSGANPVVILNKADVCENVDEILTEVESIAFGVPIHAVSAIEGKNISILNQYLNIGQTSVFLGSSGVGKSTIINSILGEERQHTQETRTGDDRGRHTTTRREMVFLPNGGIIIDTPGMREIQAWDGDQGLSRTFGDIEELISQCQFSNCQHDSEPGCAVCKALETGKLDSRRYESYLKLQKELMHIELRKDVRAQRQQHRDWDKRIRRHHQTMKDLRKKGLA